MKFLFFFCQFNCIFGVTLFELERNQQPAWVYQVESIDVEMGKLKKEIEALNSKAEEAEKSGCSDEADARRMKIGRLERRILDLKKQKESLLPKEKS